MEKYIKVPIYPLARYLLPQERQGCPSAKAPSVFEYDGATVTVDAVIQCEQGVSRKVGGRGYRFVCRVSWVPNGVLRSKESTVWYDDFYDEWFLEVPEKRAPKPPVNIVMPEITMPGTQPQSQAVSILFGEKYVREQIYPLVRYLRPEEKNGIPANKIPYAFTYNDTTIVIQRMTGCEDTDARKYKQSKDAGYRYICLAVNQREPGRRCRQHVLWHQTEQDAWFFDVPQVMARQSWDMDSEIV